MPDQPRIDTLDEPLDTVTGGDDQARVQQLARFLNVSPESINRIGLAKAEATTRQMLSQQLGRP